MAADTPIPPSSPAPKLDRRGALGRIAAAVGALLLSRPKAAVAGVESTLSVDPWIGEIALVPFNFPPKGWAFCNGQLLPINQNQALFALIGTYYGGDGITTFALPDLRGRSPVHQGQGPGLSSYVIGQTGGLENVTLGIPQIPAHTHQATGSSANGTSDSPVGAVPARDPAGTPRYAAAPNASLAAAAIATVGGGQPHENRAPYLTMNYVIALQGVFPSQN
jgi:microcystin-dependent protein